MAEPDFTGFLHSIVETLERLGLTYMVGGSVASSIYGEPRATRDVDLAVVLPIEQAANLAEAFQAFGYYAHLDAILDAIIARQPFNIIDARSGYKADIYVIDPQDPTPQEYEALQRRRRQVFEQTTGKDMVLYAPEDVILYKLKYYRDGRMPKHLRDIGAMILVQSDSLDYEYLRRGAIQLGVAEVLEELLAEYRRLTDGKPQPE
jgi:hypothetical protein